MHWLVPVAILAASTAAHAAGTATVRVVDATGLPLPGVTVTFSGSSDVWFTDERGCAFLPDLAPGHLVGAVMQGFQPTMLTVSMPETVFVLSPQMGHTIDVTGISHGWTCICPSVCVQGCVGRNSAPVTVSGQRYCEYGTPGDRHYATVRDLRPQPCP